MIGIILSSKLIDGELQVDFGQISPAELPLANSKLFVHQYKHQVLQVAVKEIILIFP